ncbi:hypothetical protein EUGRSUZ_L01926 [Eucalyptus grandis]|uniref:Uncharacterized protein n=1 Tax=Eucalyptus grandis TaxID=71139 RepID=A0A058ZSZ9_EUCGR|nr:hypothetical protein EUGRSUZ_L01926 [Eucalyptus grandis]
MVLLRDNWPIIVWHAGNQYLVLILGFDRYFLRCLEERRGGKRTYKSFSLDRHMVVILLYVNPRQFFVTSVLTSSDRPFPESLGVLMVLELAEAHAFADLAFLRFLSIM